MTASDFGKSHVCSGAANYSVTLPSPVNQAGSLIQVRMSPTLTGLVTILPHAAETIDGAASRIMWAGESAILLCDGTNWAKVAGKSRAMVGALTQAVSQNVPTAVVTGITVDTVGTDNTGKMCSVGGHSVTIQRPGIYTCLGECYYAPVGGGLATACPRALVLIQKNAATILQAELSSVIGGYPCPLVLGDVSLAAADVLTLQSFQNSGSTQPTQTSGGASPQLVVEEIVQW